MANEAILLSLFQQIVGICHSEASTNLKGLTKNNNFKLPVIFGILNWMNWYLLLLPLAHSINE